MKSKTIKRVFRIGEGRKMILRAIKGSKKIDINFLSKKLRKHTDTIRYHLRNIKST